MGCRVSWSSGSGRKSSKPNQRPSSLRASWRSRHQSQWGSLQAVSRRRRTSNPACGNSWRTQGGITELPSDTDSHASAYASGQPWRPGLGQHFACVGPAGDPRQPCGNRLARLLVGRPQRTAQAREEGVEAGPLRFSGCEPVPGGDQIRCFLDDRCQGAPLIMEEIQREAGIELWIVQAPPLELSILIVLDQVVVGVAGEGKRIEPQRIHRRHAQQPEVGLRSLELREIEGDQVVSEQKCRAVGECIQLRERRRQVAASKVASAANRAGRKGSRSIVAAPSTTSSATSFPSSGASVTPLWVTQR